MAYIDEKLVSTETMGMAQMDTKSSTSRPFVLQSNRAIQRDLAIALDSSNQCYDTPMPAIEDLK